MICDRLVWPIGHAKQRKLITRVLSFNGLPISGQVDRTSATETVHLGSIPGRVKPKTIKLGIHSFLA